MLIQDAAPFDILEFIAIIIGYIIEFVRPFISPIGDIMILWVNILLPFFPDSNLTIYIVIYVVLVVAALLVNIKWHGEYEEDEEKTVMGEEIDQADLESNPKEEKKPNSRK